jgi:GNAT superfamily N-acetyltransferase
MPDRSRKASLMSSVELVEYSGEFDSRISSLLSRSHYLPYRYLARDPDPGLARVCLDLFVSGLEGGDGEAYLALDGEDLVGIVECRESRWESETVGKRAGEIKFLLVSEDSSPEAKLHDRLVVCAIDWARRNRIQYVLSKTNSDNIMAANALEANGFLLVDTLLDYVCDMVKHPLSDTAKPPLMDGAAVREATACDIEQLAELARSAFASHYGRFHQCGWIDKATATKVYEEWIRASCAGYADWVVVMEAGERLAGFAVWKKPSKLESELSKRVGHFSIGAVHPEFAGRGVFSSLTYRGMQLLSESSECIEGPTHINNYAVQKAYSRLNWQIVDARHSFVKWIGG